MAQNAGIRDGDFVRFAGWDVSGADYAYLPKLQGNIAELKKVVTEKHGNAFLAFNTNGWIKSWAVLDWSKFITSPNSTLYVRVEYPGYYFAQGVYPCSIYFALLCCNNPAYPFAKHQYLIQKRHGFERQRHRRENSGR